jgi:hypothetical protein
MPEPKTGSWGCPHCGGSVTWKLTKGKKAKSKKKGTKTK